MPAESGSIRRPEPLAFFLNWTTYGSWLPGDSRGWVDDRGSTRPANAHLRRLAFAAMRDPPVALTPPQRDVVERAIDEQCRFRGWMLHAATCRTAHVHAVVSAAARQPGDVLRCLKSWCSRRLSQGTERTRTWWTRGGSTRWLFETLAVQDVVAYVLECQDKPRA